MSSIEYLAFGAPLARQAGDIMQAERGGQLHVERKADGTWVTHVDKLIQDIVVDAILTAFPGHAIKGEEGKRWYGPRHAKHIWRVDPIDATREYMEGEDPDIFSYGFGLSKEYEGKLEAGLFFNSSRNELFTAGRGLGAFLNGERIRVNRQSFEPGMAYDYHYWEGAQIDTRILEPLLGRPLGYESAIYQGCMVALGKSAFSVFPGNTLHDIKPAEIIVVEACGSVIDAFGNPSSNAMRGAIFSNGLVETPVLAALHPSA
jgi:myo-inositol-1(or 4)-monophosphatase